MGKIYITCGRCGSYLGSATTQQEAAVKNGDHLKECSVDFWSSN